MVAASRVTDFAQILPMSSIWGINMSPTGIHLENQNYRFYGISKCVRQSRFLACRAAENEYFELKIVFLSKLPMRNTMVIVPFS